MGGSVGWFIFRLLQNSESIALLESEEVESHLITQDFGVAVGFQKKIVDRHLLLSLVTRGFASLGMCVEDT